MYTITHRASFDAAHRLPAYPGKCQNLHGHTWYADVEIQSRKLDSQGMVIDFVTLKQILQNLLPDHKYLNDDPGLSQPTAENLAEWLFKKLEPLIPQTLKSVTVWESSHSGAKYDPETD